ncbi:MAG: hypothetical protein K9G48_00340 [Reyranella sp.]|nr:hypothetical protein [Reyranella sp.]
MLRIVLKAAAYGLVGLIVTPIVVSIVVLTAAHLLDPSCGTPGDSGGCEMGAVGIGMLSALPGLAIGVAFALFQSYRRRTK